MAAGPAGGGAAPAGSGGLATEGSRGSLPPGEGAAAAAAGGGGEEGAGQGEGEEEDQDGVVGQGEWGTAWSEHFMQRGDYM